MERVKKEEAFLTHRRGAFKGQVTQVRNRLTAVTSPTLGQAEAFLSALQKARSGFEETQILLEEQFPEHRTDAVTSEFLNEVLDLEGQLRQLIVDLKVQAGAHSTSSSNRADESPPRPQLPELKMREFDGSKKKWLSYKKFMEDVIISRPDIDDVRKYHYLECTCVEGDAADIVSSVANSDFVTAWSNLNDHYNDTELKYSVVEELYGVSRPKEGDSKSLNEFIHKVETNLNYLHSIQVATDQWDLLLGIHLLRRLDNTSRKDFEKQRKFDQIFTIKELLDFLKNRARVLSIMPTSSDFQPKNTSTPYQKASQSKDGGKAVNRSFPAVIETRKCSFCDEVHSILRCNKLIGLKPEDIKAKAVQLQLCFNCLRGGHLQPDCPSKFTCRECGLKHHTLLHIVSKA